MPLRRSPLVFLPVRLIQTPDSRTLCRGICCSVEFPLAGIGVIQAGSGGGDDAKEQRHLTARRRLFADFAAMPTRFKHEARVTKAIPNLLPVFGPAMNRQLV